MHHRPLRAKATLHHGCYRGRVPRLRLYREKQQPYDGILQSAGPAHTHRLPLPRPRLDLHRVGKLPRTVAPMLSGGLHPQRQALPHRLTDGGQHRVHRRERGPRGIQDGGRRRHHIQHIQPAQRQRRMESPRPGNHARRRQRLPQDATAHVPAGQPPPGHCRHRRKTGGTAGIQRAQRGLQARQHGRHGNG